MERLHERPAMRRRRKVQERVMHRPQRGPLACGQIVQRRIFDLEVALPHRAVHARDGVTGGARQAGLRFGRVDLLFDRTIEAAVEEHGVIVAARAPLRWPRARDVLHVLDRLAVPLIVERGEMMDRRAPLLVNIAMAARATVGRHEEIRGNRAAQVCVG